MNILYSIFARQTVRSLVTKGLTAIMLSTVLIACAGRTQSESTTLSQSTTDSDTLEIWWEKGFTVEEDEALQTSIHQWERKTGKKIKLSFYSSDELSQKAERELRTGNLPDIIASFKSERAFNPRLAWEGKLADVSDVIKPVKNLYSENALESVNFYNNIEKKRSYYAVPLYQATMHVYYRKDLLKKVGKTEKDIPKEWDKFWQFWGQVQKDLRTKQNLNIYGLGLPLSVESGDTYQTFEQLLEAYDIAILDEQGQLQVDNPQVREGIIKILKWYAQTYKQGYFSPDALHWLNPDNNRDLLNSKILMTTNATLSIPATVRQDPDTYQNKIGIVELPNKPNGQPMRYFVMVEQLILLSQSNNQKTAKDFLSYLIEPDVIGQYLKASGGRHSPVLKSVWKDPFWINPKDPHISTATKTFTESPTRLYYTFDHPAYSQVLKENVWGEALGQVLEQGKSPEQAADAAITRIKQIFQEWQ